VTPSSSNLDSFTFGQSGGTVTETASTAIAAGHADSFTIVVSAPSGLASGAAFNDTALITSSTSDPNAANNSSTAPGTIATSADVSVTVSGPSSVTAGTNATYTITLNNAGPSDAQGVVLSDLLPAGATFVSITPGSGNPEAFTFGQSGSTVTETASGAVAAGHSDSFTLVVSAASTLANGAAFNDTASISASTADPNSANNSATAAGTVATSADLSVQVSGPSTANEGDSATYTITVTNSGPSVASGVSLTDTLGSLLNFQSATTSQGTFSQSGGVVTFSIGTVAANGTVTATVKAQAIEDGSTSDVASVAGATGDPTTANNTASATTMIAEPPIVVSQPITTKAKNLTNFQVATFTHANGVEPISAFVATINWGDGTTSPGTITLSGSTYVVTGSHVYAGRGNGNHTITTTVTETGQAVDKVGDEHPGDDVQQYHSHKHGDSPDTSASGQANVAAVPGASTTFVSIKSANPSAGASLPDTRASDQFFGLGAQVVEQLLLSHRHARSLTEWFVDSAG